MTQEEFFKRYTYDVVEDRIGGGGFGTVYKAYDNVLHHEVAIKVSEVKKTANGKVFSLKDEVEALNGLPDHPNIANYEKDKLFTFMTPQGIFDYAVMQYYPDGNLSNAIKQGLTAEQKEDIAMQLLEGIDFLHKHKVVHRDLKPGNILIVKHGGKVIPLITDFGLSKAAGVVDGSVFSNSFGAGTPKYSSPEQLQGQPLRFNTDLWSYGAILYELFTGEQLFSAGSGAANTAQADMEVYNKIVNGDVQSLGKMPEKWRKVAERCLVVDATKRAKDATELFAIIKGDDDETEITIGPSTGSGTTGSGTTSSGTEGSGISIPSSKGADGPTPPSKGAGGIKKASPTSTDKPKSKKALWIALGAAAAVALLVLFLLPKKEPTPNDPDTEAYEACQTVADYRAYMRDYGRNALHYAEAKANVDQYMADSTAKAQQLAAQLQAQQQAEADTKAQAEAEKREETAYKKCTTVAACDSYLKAYPNGKYVEEVKAKKAELEAQAQQEADKKEEAAYKKCTTVEGCDSYLKDYPQGRYVTEVRKKKAELEKAQQSQQSLTGSANGHEWVDLGLPSGTLWATCNIGASKPEGYGNYYAWGETSTKSTYSEETYKYANGNYDKLTKYCNKSHCGNNGFSDNLTTLQSGDDPATAAWGSGWYTPDAEQWNELWNNTTNAWTTQNGVNGRLFTAKNGQTLFLPAASLRWDSELSDLNFVGIRGYYWSRSLYTRNPRYAWACYFHSGCCDILYDIRGYGHSVRPVRSAPQN